MPMLAETERTTWACRTGGFDYDRGGVRWVRDMNPMWTVYEAFQLSPLYTCQDVLQA